jgi:DNA-binding XRE family transcriptional regulator
MGTVNPAASVDGLPESRHVIRSSGGRRRRSDWLGRAHPRNRAINIIVSGQDRLRTLQRRMRTKYLSALGRRVRGRREQLSLSQATLARRAGVHLNVVGRLERGVYNPSILRLLAIARALRVQLQTLI